MSGRYRWLPELSRDSEGQPLATATEWRLARGLAAIATLWLTLVACWGLLGPLLAGHYASSASVGIIGENMLRWDIAGPVWRYTGSKPSPAEYYCHHPWGIFWTQAAFMWLLGRHDFVCRLPAIVASVATVPLLYKLGTALWRPLAGAAAALAFVVLPITLSFAHFNALEVPVMAYSTLALWGYARYLRRGRRRHLLASLGGLFLALNADWPAFMLAGALLAGELLRLTLGGPRRALQRRVLTWWVGAASLSVVVGVGYLALFQHYGKLADLLQSYGLRSASRELPLSELLRARRYWIELMFTPLAVWLGKLGAAVLLVRALAGRRWTALLPLSVLVMASGQYLLFTQGAEVHIFWPHYFALFFALAMGALVATAMGQAERSRRSAGGAREAGPGLVQRASYAAAVVCLLPLGLVLRDAIAVASYARASGGRFNEKGLYIDSDGDKTAVLTYISTHLSADDRVGLHPSMRATWSQVWALGGRVVDTNAAAPLPSQQAFVADARFVEDARLQAWLEQYPVTTIGPFWWIGSAQQAGGQTWMLDTREPGWLDGYLNGAHEPRYSLALDPYASWEWAHHFGQRAPIPAVPPQGDEQLRIAHNIALAEADGPGAGRFRAQLLQDFEANTVIFANGTRLLGQRYLTGARPELVLMFEAVAPMPPGLRPALRSRVVAPAGWSTTMADPTVREVGAPLALKPHRWRPGMLYSYRASVRQRPGTEVFELYWRSSNSPRPGVGTLLTSAGEAAVEVLRLPR